MNETSLDQVNTGQYKHYPTTKILKKPLRTTRSQPLKWISVIIFFGLWEIFSRINAQFEWMNPLFLPAPSAIVEGGWIMAQTGIITESIIASTIRIGFGFTIGLLVAVGLSILMSRSIIVENGLGSILNLIGPIPALALLPIFIIWFGIGEFPKIILIAWTTFIPIHVYTLEGLKSVNPILIQSALSLGAKRRHIFMKVILPSAVPSILAGAQVSLGLAFSALVVSEMMGADSGLGYIIVDARNYFKMTNMFVAIVLIGLEYSLFAFGIKLIERKVMAWRKDGIRDAVEKRKNMS